MSKELKPIDGLRIGDISKGKLKEKYFEIRRFSYAA